MDTPQVKRGRKIKVDVPKPKLDYKPIIIDALDKLRTKELSNKEPFKARAYATVLTQLRSFEGPIHSLNDIEHVKGIGEKIREKIKEILDTGELHQLNENQSMNIFKDLTKVHGIGPSKARDLIDKFDIKSIEDLVNRQNEPGILNDVQKKGLKYYKDFQERIPRTEMKKHETYILGVIERFGKDIKAALAGSYRREEPSSGDIDVLITGCNVSTFESIIDMFKNEGYIVDTFALGNKKVMATGILPNHTVHRRVDFMLTEESVYPFALLYFTGSGEFNVNMRNWAIAKGYSLSEYGLKKIGDNNFVDHPFSNESDIFRFLGIQYVEPQKRKNPMVKISSADYRILFTK